MLMEKPIAFKEMGDMYGVSILPIIQHALEQRIPVAVIKEYIMEMGMDPNRFVFQPVQEGKEYKFVRVGNGQVVEDCDMFGNVLTSPKAKKSCSHTWATYQGFTDTYEYCTQCDVKRGD